LGDRIRLSSEGQVPLIGNLFVVGIRHGEKVDDQVQQRQAEGSVIKPQSRGLDQ